MIAFRAQGLMATGTYRHVHSGVSRRGRYVVPMLGAVAMLGISALSPPRLVYAGGDEAASSDSITEPLSAGWNRVEDSDSASASGPVLEVPQVTDPQQAAARSKQNRDAQQQSDDDDGPAADTSAANADLGADDSGQLGSLDDYEQQDVDVSGGILLVPVPVGSLTPMPASPGAPGQLVRGGMMPTSPIIMPHGAGFPAIPATSPMLSAPRGTMVSPGGGFWSAGRR